MKQISGKEFIRLLTKTRLAAQAHHRQSPHFQRIVVPVHGNQPLKLGLLKHQMKIAGLTEADL